jgi:peptidyl-tRNA hydrolase
VSFESGAATVDEWRHRWRHRVVDEEAEVRDPWALPLVVRVERTGPPSHLAALHAAAVAVVAILTRPEAAPALGTEPAGPWHPALARWSDGRIRKVVRRARASRWEEVTSLPGVTGAVDGAEVRAVLPHPVAEPPPALARLQIAGLDLPREEPTSSSGAAEPSPRLTILTAPGLDLTTGKACAQVGHAAQLGLLELERSAVLSWTAAGHPLRIVEPDAASWDRLRTAGSGVALVRDGGFTEVAPGTITCAATFAPL